MPELGSLGTVRGALGNERPYREQSLPEHPQASALFMPTASPLGATISSSWRDAPTA